jgi:hydrogenase/urease accessory protein HupE
MFLDWLDDKTQVIIALLALAIIMLWRMPTEAGQYVNAIIGALAGMVVGENLVKNNK